MFLLYFAITLAVTVLAVALPLVVVRNAVVDNGGETEVPVDLVAVQRYSRSSVAIALVAGVVAGLIGVVGWGIAWHATAQGSGSELIGPLAVTTFGGGEDVGMEQFLGVLVAPGLFGVTSMAVLRMRERRSPIVTNGPVSASLKPRRGSDYVPRWASVAAGTALAMVASLLVIGMVTSDDTGTALRVQWRGDEGELVTSIVGPWPGWVFAGPILLALLVEVVLAAMTLRDIAVRGHLTSGFDAGVDRTIRCRSAEAVIGLLLLSVAWPMLVLGLSMGPVLGYALGAQPIVGIGVGVVGAWAFVCASAGLVFFCGGCVLLMRRLPTQKLAASGREVKK
ncbi:hypothetical protein [Actinobaculum sp. 313]|uniref:hypothetical protein n=1 Tax=Actinobaculum sp. 313 TaxID=2495645 RepID=UPI000D5276B5|nr:hypothetical protein [Actinobaculum sp. 313]AWE41604.1 hypothetical protein DDD63_01175 [Actinobaculum sp. 313]